jgi:Glyoxalase superfamily protein/Clp amino terminal domain, pathogenicity island component
MVNVSQPFTGLCTRTTGQQRKPWRPDFVRAKDADMRDFRDAKAMAGTLRAALATKGFKITIGQSLELIAEAFGMADWNTLAAVIRKETGTPRHKESQLPPASAVRAPLPAFSSALDSTLQRAVAYASERDHEYTTLEHLLLALINDADAAAVMEVCKVDLGALKEDLVSYIDGELKALVIADGRDSRPTPGLQRVVERAALGAQIQGRDPTGADLLVAIFDEKESHAAWFLSKQDMTQQDAANSILQAIVRASRAPRPGPRSS